MKSIQSSEPKAYCIRGQEQMSLFSEQQLAAMNPNKRQPKKLFALVESPDGSSWWQELQRVKGERPWQTCMRYKRESLGRGYWICTYELR